MKFWPGYVASIGDNPPWNMLDLPSMGLSLRDNGSLPSAVSDAVLKAIIEENNRKTGFTVEAANNARIDIRLDLLTMKSIYGAIVSNTKNYYDPLIHSVPNIMFHRVEILAALAGANTTSNPRVFTLPEVYALMDNQISGAPASTLTDAAISFTSSDNKLIEFGVQVGSEFNGFYYPQVVEYIGIISDQASILSNCSIYASMDGNIWYPVLKRPMSTNGWSNGEYYVSPWRAVEVGATTEKGRIYAFVPTLANFVKVVFNNAAGNAIDLNEIFAFNSQGDVGFTKDFSHYRNMISSVSGDRTLFCLANLPLYNSSGGPVGPSGSTGVLDTATGIWSDPNSQSWYDPTIRGWVRSNGTVYNGITGQWQTLIQWQKSAYAASTSLTSTPLVSTDQVVFPDTPQQSTMKSTNAREIKFRFWPYQVNPTLSGFLTIYELNVFDDPRLVDTADSDGVRERYDEIPAVPNDVGEWVEKRIYNNSNQPTRAVKVYLDTYPILAKDMSSPRDYKDDPISMLFSNYSMPPGVIQLIDLNAGGIQSSTGNLHGVKKVLNKAKTDVGDYDAGGTTRGYEILSRHGSDDSPNEITSSNPSGTELGPYPDLYALVMEIKTNLNSHMGKGTSIHAHADTLNVIASADPSANTDLPQMLVILNEVKRNLSQHYSNGNGDIDRYSHYLADVWNMVTAENATDEASAAALAIDVKTMFNKHIAYNMQGWSEVETDPGVPGEWYLFDYDNATLTLGAYADDYGNAIRFWYASQGTYTTQICENESTPVSWPNQLQLINGIIPAAGYTTYKIRANLTGYTEQQDRNFRAVIEVEM